MIIFLRNFKTRKRFWVVLAVVLSFACFISSTEFFAEEELKMYASSYALTDGSTGRVLDGKNETAAMANASTTKILTCIVTLENCDLNEQVYISKNASLQPKVRLGMGEGEQYLLKDMLYGLMLESYNDCAVAIAEHVAGSVENFADMMNQKAIEIGCENTFFITPNGLDKENGNQFHHTTAADLCKIMAYCVWESPMKDMYLQITQTKEYSGASNGNAYTFVNRNALLGQVDGLLSGKTGYTSKAGYCYVAAYEKNGEKFCVALLACGWPNNKNWKWMDTNTLLSYAKENYDVKKVTINEIEEEMIVDGYVYPMKFALLNQDDVVKIRGEKQEYIVLLGKDENIRKEILLYTDTILPIEKGQIMGQCNIYIEENLLDSVLLVSEDFVKEWELKDVVYAILCQFLTFSY